MKTTLIRVENPYVFELKNELGRTCTLDASPGIGGTNQGFRPMELLAGSLAGCVAIDLIGILKKQRIDPALFKISIEGVRKDAIPSPFEEILLKIEVDPVIDREKLTRNVKLVLEKYCSVAHSLDDKIVIRYEII